MRNEPMFFSMLFFFASFFYCFFGIYTLYANSKEWINRSFFVVCFSLFIWSFSFSIANSASDMETCLFWRRISVLGWGTFYSAILVFFIIFTEKKWVLKKWWGYFIYLFPLCMLYIFALSDKHVQAQYQFVRTSYGWTNVAVNNGWDMLFYLYYIGYIVMGLIMVALWRMKKSEYKMKRQADIILVSFLITFVVATFTDVLGNSVLMLNIPQIAPLLLVFPVAAICYSMWKYQFMNANPVSDEELILNEVHRNKIYRYLSSAFITGGFLNFISMYIFYKGANLMEVLITTFLLQLIGLGIKVLQYSRLTEETKGVIILIMILLSIPGLTLRYIAIGGITVWAFPFLLITISLLMNNLRALLLIVAVTIITQVLVWIKSPQVMVTVGGADYIARIGMVFIDVWLAYYVNKVYLIRLKENSNQTKFQKLLADISSSFMTVSVSNFDEKINFALRESGQFFKIDRASMILFEIQNQTMNSSHEWCVLETPPLKILFNDMQFSENTDWIQQLFSNQVVNFVRGESSKQPSRNLNTMPPNSYQSMTMIPLAIGGQILGFLELDMVTTTKNWRQDDVNLLKILSNAFSDTLAKIQAEKEINYMAYYDPLTALPNRVLFKEHVNQAMRVMDRTKKVLGIVFLDLDSFKNINDTLGHGSGDELLKKVASELVQCLRKSDTVCRFGGDEFLILLNGMSSRGDVISVTEKIMGIFQQTFKLKEQNFVISASAGVAIYPEDGDDSDMLIKNADLAMFNAKEMGKGQFMMCSEDMRNEMQLKLKLMNHLYRALERKELFLQYQPQIDLKTMRMIGLEALMRWAHPEMGIISPGVFIPLAEQTGLINNFGEWALETACRQNKTWQDMGLPPVRMAVNLSVQQFRNPKLVEQVARILKETGLEAKYLELEITESIAIKEENYIIQVLNDLKQLGVSISIDDFGTEYSSLSRLKILPIDRIKIDMQFVKGIETNIKDRAITDIIINLAKKLGLSVISEGVETKEQLDFLCERMCDEVQGYYFYKPMSVEDIGVLLKTTT